ncbi:MAG: hypothetical protein QOE33_863 [Acidobacteriota bacterium]|nr:hypothetical protein [Acidobacteriota bacterium]
MNIAFVRRAHIACFVLLAFACAGTACHPSQPAAQGGAPYVWVCTPASFPTVGGVSRADLYVFNGGGTNANVAVNILDINGNNLAGHNIPGTNPARTYPGQTGTNTVALAPAHTLDVDWMTPTTASPPQFDGVTDVSFSVRVTSDQPIVVGSNFWWSGPATRPCSLLPK